MNDAYHRIGHSRVCIPSSTLPSWLPASFSLGIFSFSLKPPSLPLPVFFLDATLIVASSSAQVTLISRVSSDARRGCDASLTFPILSHGGFQGLAPSRSRSECPSFRQRCVGGLVGTGGFCEGLDGRRQRGLVASSKLTGFGPQSLGFDGEYGCVEAASKIQGQTGVINALLGLSKKHRPGGAVLDGDKMSQDVLDDESHVVATVQEWLGCCRWTWGETHAPEPGPRLHCWGSHICTDNGRVYATRKSYSIRAYIRMCYVSPLQCSRTSPAPHPSRANPGEHMSSQLIRHLWLSCPIKMWICSLIRLIVAKHPGPLHGPCPPDHLMILSKKCLYCPR